MVSVPPDSVQVTFSPQEPSAAVVVSAQTAVGSRVHTITSASSADSSRFFTDDLSFLARPLSA